MRAPRAFAAITFPGPSRARGRLVLAAAVIALAAGCRGPEPEPLYELAPPYELVSMDGEALPYTYRCDPNDASRECVVEGGQATLTQAGNLRVAYLIRTPGAAMPSLFASTDRPHTRAGNTIRIYFGTGAEPEYRDVHLGRDELTDVIPAVGVVRERQGLFRARSAEQ